MAQARSGLAVATLTGLLLPLAAGAAIPSTRTVSGQITKLSPTGISVDRLHCAIKGNGMAVRSSAFVLGDYVRITCRGGTLEGIRYHPPASAGSVSTKASPPAVAAPPPARVYACGSSPGPSAGSTTTTPDGRVVDTWTAVPTASVCAIGPLIAFAAGTVSVAGLTCGVTTQFYNSIVNASREPYAVGDEVRIGCSNGQLTEIAHN